MVTQRLIPQDPMAQWYDRAKAAEAKLEALEPDAAKYRWLVATTHPDNLRKLFYGYEDKI